jgi:hypothetical protein
MRSLAPWSSSLGFSKGAKSFMPDTKKENDFDEDEAMRRFERAVDVALHTRPIHKESPKKTPTKPKAKKPKASQTS